MKYVSAIVLAGVLLAACEAKVTEDAASDDKNVDLRSPIGNLSVRTSMDAPDTGLPVYPGAKLLKDDEDDGDSADVNISSPLFGLRVVAAEFASDDEPQKVVEFYRNEMKNFGDVVECRGNVDFEVGDGGGSKPVCKEQASRDVQLVAGTAENHRLIAVKPRGSGSEFAMVYIDARERT
jgi:hypothetical protein